ncbi:MAG TPA: hypothetical protein VMJ32_02345 [Pirellulales bacterium]|nr:hypothetical protein [Pirellulales bacterium]
MNLTVLLRADCRLMLAFVLALAWSPNAGADTNWMGTTGSWYTDGNWDSGAPNSSVNANINNGGTAQIGSSSAFVSFLNLGQSSSQSGLVSLTGGSLTADDEQIGVAGSGTFTHSAGANNFTASGTLVLGANTNSTGIYYLSGTGAINPNLSGAAFEYIGEGGSGTMNQSGGSNSATTIYMASGSINTSGNYNLSGGTLSAAILYIGYQGTGVFSQTGGSFNISNTLSLLTTGSSLSIANAADTAATLNNNGVLTLAGATATATAGALSLSGNYHQTNELDIGLGGPNAGTDYGALTTTASASLSGTLKVTLTNNFIPFNGETFNIISAQSRTNTFSQTSLPTFSGGHFNLNYTSTGVTLTAVVVPEPNTLVLLGMALPFALRRIRNGRFKAAAT